MQRQTGLVAILAGASWLALAMQAGAADAELVQADDPYFKQAQAQMQRILTQQRNTNRAKNVILVVGDGMGFSTVTATRIFEGQERGVDGESNVLAWEAFPHLAASKTYSSDAQITDSRAERGGDDRRGEDDQRRDGHRPHLDPRRAATSQKTKAVTTLWEMAETVGMSTGVITTARLTHATPGATYSHIANRDWESDADMPPEALAAGCKDIAAQLVEMRLRRRLRGGDGRRPRELPAGGDGRPGGRGREGRAQGRARPDPGLARRATRTAAPSSGTRSSSTRSTRPSTDHLLGLFERSHMKYEHDRAERHRRRAVAGRDDREGDRHPVAEPGGVPADDRGRPHRPRQPREQRLPHGDRRGGAERGGEGGAPQGRPRRDADRGHRRPQPHADDRRLRQARQPDPRHLDRRRRRADPRGRRQALHDDRLRQRPGRHEGAGGAGDADDGAGDRTRTSCSNRSSTCRARPTAARISASTRSVPGRTCSRARSRRTTPST